MALDPTFFTKIFPIIMEIFTDYIGPLVNNRVYWSATTQKQFPRIIYQSQDLGGITDNKIGKYGWRGLITVRVMDRDPATPHLLLSQVCTVLDTVASTYNNNNVGISIRYGKPIPFPQETVDDGIIYTAAVIITMTIDEQ